MCRFLEVGVHNNTVASRNAVMHKSIETTPPPPPPGHSGGVSGTWLWYCAFVPVHFSGGKGTVTVC